LAMFRTAGSQCVAKPTEDAVRTCPCVEAWANRCGFSRPARFHRFGGHLREHGSRCDRPAHEAPIYAHTGAVVASIVSELPESVPKPSSLQWQRCCPRRASDSQTDQGSDCVSRVIQRVRHVG
jgi:hypothetical protein